MGKFNLRFWLSRCNESVIGWKSSDDFLGTTLKINVNFSKRSFLFISSDVKRSWFSCFSELYWNQDFLERKLGHKSILISPNGSINLIAKLSHQHPTKRSIIESLKLLRWINNSGGLSLDPKKFLFLPHFKLILRSFTFF
jgi:hypothetical protein